MLKKSMFYLLVLILAWGCFDDDTDIDISPMIEIIVDSVGMNENGRYLADYCPSGIFSQILRSEQQSNQSTYTVEFGTDLPPSTYIRSVTVLLVGNDSLQDTLFQSRVSVYNNIKEILSGNDNIESYIKLTASQNGNEYVSVFYDLFSTNFTILDRSANYEIDFVVYDEDSICDNNDYVVIESKLSYDGFLYNRLDSNDSIKVTGFNGIIFNASN